MKRLEKWVVREIRPGDMLRVWTGRYYHFGIYAGSNTVIHFAGPDPHTLTDASVARIRKDSLEHFAMGKGLEVREYSLAERLKKRPAKKVVAEAESRMGEAGYDIIYNNCEHFANRCVFGVAYSAQIDGMRESLDK